MPGGLFILATKLSIGSVVLSDIKRLWGMPAGMAIGVGGSTLLYRKTGNTWLCAFLMGSVAALFACTFGQVRIF